MKDPTELHFETDRWEEANWAGSDSLCNSCLTAWPCAKIEKWWASDTYKVQKLQEGVEYLKKANARQGREISELREQGRRNDIVIRGCLIPFVNDLALGVTDGQVTFSLHRDYDDITDFKGAVGRVGGLVEWHAKYESSRILVEDGEVKEMRYSKP